MAPSTKPKALPAHPTYSVMIAAGIVALKERSGSSRQAILKYIKANYKVGDNVDAVVRNQLPKLVKNGVLVQTKGKGASGSFKVAKKPAAPKPKKAASPKKKKSAVKKEGKKKSPAKKSAQKKSVGEKKKSASTKAKKPSSPKKKKSSPKKKTAAAKKKPVAKKAPAKKPAAKKSAGKKK